MWHGCRVPSGARVLEHTLLHYRLRVMRKYECGKAFNFTKETCNHRDVWEMRVISSVSINLSSSVSLFSLKIDSSNCPSKTVLSFSTRLRLTWRLCLNTSTAINLSWSSLNLALHSQNDFFTYYTVQT